LTRFFVVAVVFVFTAIFPANKAWAGDDDAKPAGSERPAGQQAGTEAALQEDSKARVALPAPGKNYDQGAKKTHKKRAKRAEKSKKAKSDTAAPPK
jgi:hypothetical protein